MAKTPFVAKHGLDVGNGLSEDQLIRIKNGNVNPPALKFNETEQQWEFSNDGTTFAPLGSGSGSGENIYREINQAGHGFDLDFIYNNGTTWVKAQADDSATCATHFAMNIDVDNFIAVSIGDVDVTGMLDDAGSPIVAGSYYFLSQTVAGKVTASSQTDGITQSVLKVNESNSATVLIEEPYDITKSSSDVIFAEDESLTANQITLNVPNVTAYVDGQVYNVKIANSNDGATTINVNSIGAVNIFLNQSALTGGELISGSIYSLIYNGTGGYFELFKLGGGGAGGVESVTNKITTASTTWNAVAVSDVQMSTVCVETDNMIAGSIDIEVDGVVLDTVSYTDPTYSSNFGFESTINIITSSDFAGSSYVNVKYGSGQDQELTKFDAIDENITLNTTEDKCAEIIIDGRNGGGVIEVDADGAKTDYEIANELLEKIKVGYSNNLTLKSKDGLSLSASTYDNISFDVSGQDLTPASLTFNADYTKFYVLGNSTDTIYQYTMGETLDTSTYDNISFDVSGQDSNPASLAFNSDYTKFYVLGTSTDTIYQYTMGSDISLSTYDNISFDVSGQDSTPFSLAFNSDYTKFYVLGNSTDTIYQYTMGATLDTSTYDNISFDVSGQDLTPASLTFNADYTKFYVLGNSTDTIYQYTMGETLDTSTYDNISFDVSGQDSIPFSLTFNADYTKFYVLGNSTGTIYQYTFGKPFDGEVFVSIEY